MSENSKNSNIQSCKNGNKSSKWFDSSEKPFVEEILETMAKNEADSLPAGEKRVPKDKLCDPNCKLREPVTGYCPMDVVRRLEDVDLIMASSQVLLELHNHPECNIAKFYLEGLMSYSCPDKKLHVEYLFSLGVQYLVDPNIPIHMAKKILERAQQLGSKDAGELLKRLK